MSDLTTPMRVPLYQDPDRKLDENEWCTHVMAAPVPGLIVGGALGSVYVYLCDPLHMHTADFQYFFEPVMTAVVGLIAAPIAWALLMRHTSFWFAILATTTGTLIALSLGFFFYDTIDQSLAPIYGFAITTIAIRLLAAWRRESVAYPNPWLTVGSWVVAVAMIYGAAWFNAKDLHPWILTQSLHLPTRPSFAASAFCHAEGNNNGDESCVFSLNPNEFKQTFAGWSFESRECSADKSREIQWHEQFKKGLVIEQCFVAEPDRNAPRDGRYRRVIQLFTNNDHSRAIVHVNFH